MNPKSIFVFSFLLLISILFVLTSCAGPIESLYIEKCSDCHGEDGTGKKANVDFTRQKFSPEKIKYSIVHGKGEMANIPDIEEPELTQMINYVAGLYKEN
jgi:mono/diheme cytochrome c family protein